MANLLIAHGGAPTAVLNASLYGVIEQARESGRIQKVYGAINGDEGIMKERFLDLLEFPETMTRKLLKTPGSSIGTSRYIHDEENDWARMADIFEKYDIQYVLMQGGNGTQNTCGKLYEACQKKGVSVIGIPKTIDNDLAVVDHAPGYASTAKFIAGMVSEICCDVEALPIHISVIETMGRNAGWITAASALAREHASPAPQLIYLPERPFHMDEFLQDVAVVSEKYGGGVVVCSEGLRGEGGELLVPPVFNLGRAAYPALVGLHLAKTITKELGIKTRYEKCGIEERASVPWQSEVDVEESVMLGREAVKAALCGKSGVMVGLKRTSSVPYRTELVYIPLEQVMMYERPFPDEWINDRGNNVKDGFIQWLKPIIGSNFGDYFRISNIYKKNTGIL